MDYTIGEVAQLASVSERTLRYYDELGLVCPKRDRGQLYRLYSKEDLKRLQTVLFYRELDFDLATIKAIMGEPGFSTLQALEDQKQRLLARQSRLESLLHTLETTIAEQRGETTMTDKKRFEGLKKNLIEENEKKFGNEIRARYGEETVAEANARMMGMDEITYNEMQELNTLLLEKLVEAQKSGDCRSPLAGEVARLHKKWLAYTWPTYNKEAHANLVRMYAEDERFNAYYREKAAFLRDAVLALLESEA
ncbi:MAG TPA: MerR family transcriptional regulator [Sphaerochaeta sp.]|nr:MerR family transcriptional regulator [Sphaerochaeta sp.]